jgi:hypothetical protein
MTACTDSAAKSAACAILTLREEGKVVLFGRHESGVIDRATALDNVRDACRGSKAQM